MIHLLICFWTLLFDVKTMTCLKEGGMNSSQLPRTFSQGVGKHSANHNTCQYNQHYLSRFNPDCDDVNQEITNRTITTINNKTTIHNIRSKTMNIVGGCVLIVFSCTKWNSCNVKEIWIAKVVASTDIARMQTTGTNGLDIAIVENAFVFINLSLHWKIMVGYFWMKHIQLQQEMNHHDVYDACVF